MSLRDKAVIMNPIMDIHFYIFQTLHIPSKPFIPNQTLFLTTICVFFAHRRHFYFRVTLKLEYREWCPLLLHSWWGPLIKFMVEPTMNMRKESIIFPYSENT